ncbi:MAG: hypothetical protein HY809_01035 [Nitrospirae bacterium]|nr:hypothetical protein [Nitrospirota bacterium]
MDTTLDTLKIFERLKAADLSDKAAREIAEVAKELSNETHKGIATKEDLTDIHTKLKELEGEIKLLKWMLGVVIAGILSLIIKAFFS